MIVQRKLCRQYVGQGAAGQELFRARTQKRCQNRSFLAPSGDCCIELCQKHNFLAPADINSVIKNFVPSQNNSVFDIVKAKKG